MNTIATQNLQPYARRGILAEQRTVPDVAPHHRTRPVPGLVHDGPLRGSADSGRGRQASPERMPGVEWGVNCVMS